MTARASNPHSGQPLRWPPADLPDSLAGMSAEELAEILISGAMTAEEFAYVRGLAEQGEPNLSAALRALSPAAEALMDEAVAPPAALRAGVLARVEGDIAARDAAEFRRFSDADSSDEDRAIDHDHAGSGSRHGPVILRAKEQRWRSTGVKGVRFRTLVADRWHNRRTMLLQMDPGTTLPDHGHAGLEEVYVIEGDMYLGDQYLGPGDYFHVQPGATHGVPTSKSGCVAIVISGYSPFPMSSLPKMIWGAIVSRFRRGSGEH